MDTRYFRAPFEPLSFTCAYFQDSVRTSGRVTPAPVGPLDNVYRTDQKSLLQILVAPIRPLRSGDRKVSKLNFKKMLEFSFLFRLFESVARSCIGGKHVNEAP